ncbi:hypothetical protein SAMN04488005_2676 [Yoonia tamlensis]|uniref:Uncharacterized protein n=1 Tax=Yoonia tamlensis TaxID=390270 RepID=A0A1I6HGL9_9RHOB|nr:porin [Yoonia tamlensis]SFR53581.1 hypothetical protein SAMN04488005_2676 [Yoonia tamlensis]
MNTLSLIAATAIVSLASTASAQSFGGITHEGSTISLAYSFHNDDEGDPYSENYTKHLTATSRYALGSNLGVAVTFGYVSETWEDEYYSRRHVLDLNPYYSFGNGSVGAYYTVISHHNTDDGSLNDTQFGITADYAANGFGVEFYAGAYMEDGYFNEDTVGIAGSYEINDATQVFISHRRDIDTDGDWTGMLSLGGTYDLQMAPVSITGELTKYGHNDVSFGDSEWNQITIAASYNFGAGAQSIFRGLRAEDFFYN